MFRPLLGFSDFIFPLPGTLSKKRDAEREDERPSKRQRKNPTVECIKQILQKPPPAPTPETKTPNTVETKALPAESTITIPVQTEVSTSTVTTPVRKVRGRGSRMAGTGMKSDTIDHTEIVHVVMPIEAGREGKLLHDYSDFEAAHTSYDKNPTPTLVVDSSTCFLRIPIFTVLGHILEIAGFDKIDILESVHQMLGVEHHAIRWDLFKRESKSSTKSSTSEVLEETVRAVVIFESKESGE